MGLRVGVLSDIDGVDTDKHFLCLISILKELTARESSFLV